MATGQGSGGGSVVAAPPGPRPQPGAVVVGDGRRRLVADGPPGIVEPPHEVDVLPDLQRGVEATDVAEGVDPGHHRRGGDVPHPAAGPHPRGRGTHVEGRAARLVAGQAAGAGLRGS